MKLGIAVVYLVLEENGPLLDLHLRQIERHTNVPYTIYASVNRLLPQFRRRLEQFPRVRICPAPDTELRSGKEHSFYLERLVEAAVEDGATHIVTLHVDSFPICDHWAPRLADRIRGDCVAAAILRRENGDEMLPFAAGLMFHRDFYLTHRPTFYPSQQMRDTPDYQRYIEETQQSATDSGVGYGFCIFREGLSWYPLLRSNVRQDHFLLGGIYGDLIFHLGAAARTEKRFRGDRIQHPRRGARVHAMLRDISWRLPDFARRKLALALPSTFGYLIDAEEINLTAYTRIRSRLMRDPDRYFQYLRAGTA